MEYLRYRGEFADVPVAEMTAQFMSFYGHLMARLAAHDFDAEVSRERA
jgi:hypothetical protein